MEQAIFKTKFTYYEPQVLGLGRQTPCFPAVVNPVSRFTRGANAFTANRVIVTVYEHAIHTIKYVICTRTRRFPAGSARQGGQELSVPFFALSVGVVPSRGQDNLDLQLRLDN